MVRRACVLWAIALLTTACAKPKPPELKPISAQVSALKPEGVELSVVLDARNPNSFPIVCSSVTAKLETQSGASLGSGSTVEAFSIPGGSAKPISTKLDIRWDSVSVIAPYAMTRQPLPYRVTGTARVGGESLNMEVPFTVNGELTQEQVVTAGLRGVGALLQKP
jgi:LEA14-like dessication related protein